MTNEEILNYTNYIYGIAKKFKNYKNKEDLYQAGYIGLIDAYNHYENSKNAKFTTYAYPYIIGEMYKLVTKDKNIKLNYNLNKLSLKIEKANILLAQKYNRYPTTKELAEYLEINELDVINVLELNKESLSLEYELDENIKLCDTVSNNETNIDTLISIKDELNKLTDLEKEILTKKINNYTQEEIAKFLGINQVKVSRTLTKVKEKIRQNTV